MSEMEQGKQIDPRVIRTRECIQAAFDRLLKTTGYSEITVSAIAREARVSRKTFYAHFSSVTDLLELLSQEVVDEVAEEIQPEGELLDIDEWVSEFTRITMAKLKDHPYWSGNVVRSIPASSLMEVLRKPLERLFEEELCKRGMTIMEGHEYVLSFYIGGLCTTYETWVMHGSEESSLDSATALIARAATQGVGALLKPSRHAKTEMMTSIQKMR